MEMKDGPEAVILQVDFVSSTFESSSASHLDKDRGGKQKENDQKTRSQITNQARKKLATVAAENPTVFFEVARMTRRTRR